MTAIQAPPATDAPHDLTKKSHGRIMIAVTALLMAIAGVALVSTNSHAAVPSDRSVLACGDAPGLCPSPPGPAHSDSPPSGSHPNGTGNTWL